jgi:gluconokinase
MIVVVMGVAGAGKTTVGRALAAALGWSFLDADDLQPPANVDKMRRGEPLDDADRSPWLARVAAELRARDDVVVACSALRAAYRDALRVRPEVRFVYLKVPEAVLAARLAERRGHYMPPSLLRSQLDTLEEPGDAIVVDATQPVAEIVRTVVSQLC